MIKPILLTWFLSFNLLSNFSFAQDWIQETSNTSNNLNGCFFVNKNIGWAVGDNGTIVCTTNGGNTWTIQSSGVSSDLFGAYFLDSLQGYCVGRCYTILFTSNGGATWRILDQDPSSFCTNNPYAHDLRTIIMEDTTTGTIGGVVGGIYTTNNWTNNTTQYSGANIFNYQIIPYSSQIFTCTDQAVEMSSDYGYTWNIAGNYESNLGYLKFGYYFNSSDIFVCNQLSIYNYGLYNSQYSWIRVDTSSTYYINSLEFLNQQNGFFATSEGSIFYTNSAGNTWIQQSTYITTPLNQLFLVSDSSAWCVGDDGVILKYQQLTTGINQLSVNNNQLSIYPNPTSGQFAIKSNGNQNGYMVEIYNVVGEKIYQSVLSNSQNIINLSSQPDGMYFVYLKSNEGVEVGKVMVTK
jgi:photosystem II stability/assembly factor-like uncharacterized protein